MLWLILGMCLCELMWIWNDLFEFCLVKLFKVWVWVWVFLGEGMILFLVWNRVWVNVFILVLDFLVGGFWGVLVGVISILVLLLVIVVWGVRRLVDFLVKLRVEVVLEILVVVRVWWGEFMVVMCFFWRERFGVFMVDFFFWLIDLGEFFEVFLGWLECCWCWWCDDGILGEGVWLVVWLVIWDDLWGV